jgi:integral membrane sensor domain MASE1
MLLQISDTALYTVWGGSLVLGLVVAIVVAVLLALIVRTARQIKTATAQIWVDGQRAAGATVHIPLLLKVNRNLIGILTHTSGIMEDTGRIQQHTENCPGCPNCLMDQGGGR